MSKKRSAESRYLLIIAGDGTDYFSAPLDSPSVAKIKAEIEREKRTLARGILALALARRLRGGNKYKIDAREWAAGAVKIADDFEYVVDAGELVSDKELKAWRHESEGDDTWSGSEQLFQVQKLRDCC